MKKVIAFLLIATITESTFARIEADQVPKDNRKIFGTPNAIFVQKTCKAQLEELLDLARKTA